MADEIPQNPVARHELNYHVISYDDEVLPSIFDTVYVPQYGFIQIRLYDASHVLLKKTCIQELF